MLKDPPVQVAPTLKPLGRLAVAAEPIESKFSVYATPDLVMMICEKANTGKVKMISDAESRNFID